MGEEFDLKPKGPNDRAGEKLGRETEAGEFTRVPEDHILVFFSSTSPDYVQVVRAGEEADSGPGRFLLADGESVTVSGKRVKNEGGYPSY